MADNPELNALRNLILEAHRIVSTTTLPAMKGQLAQMKSGSAQTEQVISAFQRYASAAEKANQITASLNQAHFVVAIPYRPHEGTVCPTLTNQGRWGATSISAVGTVTVRNIVGGSVSEKHLGQWIYQGGAESGIVQAGGSIAECFELFGSLRDDTFIYKMGAYQISVNVTITYDSGFGNPRTQIICQSLVADESMNGIGRPPNARTWDCVNAEEFVRKRRQQLLGTKATLNN
jgi:hypothetical protein